MATENLSHSHSMVRLVRSNITTAVLYVAAKLELVDHIRDNGAIAQDLAQIPNVHPGALYRVMRTLAALGVLHQDEDDRFFVTQFGETLRKDSPQSVRGYAIYIHELVYERYTRIMDSVRTGKAVVEKVFDNLRSNPAQEAIFHAGMDDKTHIDMAAIIEDLRSSPVNPLVQALLAQFAMVLSFSIVALPEQRGRAAKRLNRSR